MERIKTYEDAKNYLGGCNYNESLNSLATLQTILDALNENHKFDLSTGTVWHPWVRFFKIESIPKDSEIIGHFRYRDEKFALVSSSVSCGSTTGLGCFSSSSGATYLSIGILACKSEEIAKYVSTQFGKLVFDACFAKYFKDGEFEWLD